MKTHYSDFIYFSRVYIALLVTFSKSSFLLVSLTKDIYKQVSSKFILFFRYLRMISL